jgi:hypothetical protein
VEHQNRIYLTYNILLAIMILSGRYYALLYFLSKKGKS